MARIVFTLEDGTEIETELDTDVITVGRHPDNIVVLPSGSVSGHHATVKHRGDAYYVQDLGTTNGTKLNGVEVEEAKLEDGDKLSFGDVPAVVYLKEKKAAPQVPDPSVKSSGRPVPGRGPARRTYTSYQQSSGCAGFLILLLLLSIAFVVGTFVRHWAMGRGILLERVVERVQEKFGNHEAAESSAKKESKSAEKKEAKSEGAAKPTAPADEKKAPADKKKSGEEMMMNN